MINLDDHRQLKVIIINPDGQVFPYYNDDFNIDNEDLSHFSIFEMIGKKEKRIPKKLLRQVRKAAYEKIYLDIIGTFHKFGYSIFLDTTNYNNYHNGKLHTGIWLMPKTFLNLPLLQQRAFIQLLKPKFEKSCIGNVISSILYEKVDVDYLEHENIIHTNINDYIGISESKKKEHS